MVSLTLAVVLTASAQSPLALVKDGNTALQRVLATKGVTPEKLANTVEAYVDFGELAKRALGKEWEKLTKAQQQDFTATMKGLLRASYAQNAIGQAEAKVTYGAESLHDNEAVVSTTIDVKKEAYPVVYKLYRPSEHGAWRVYDVVTDEVSLMDTYHDQFRKLISEKGFAGLLATLKAKREQLERNTPGPAAGVSPSTTGY
jgi:phospholipid transport system substrate-binding protein